MKKIFAIIISAALAVCAFGAMAETGEDIFAVLDKLDWEFTSGAGAWSTQLKINSDGTFTGAYNDSEMGETGEDYPDGTVYFGGFSGKMSFGERIDENTVTLIVDELTIEENETYIEDGIRWAACEPYGISEGDTMTLYAPETARNAVPEDMLLWTNAFGEEAGETLGCWLLTSEVNQSGFVGWETVSGLDMENPWTEMTEDELAAAAGVTFGVPEGAQDIVYLYNETEGMSEMNFFIDEDEFTARIKPSALNEGELENITGMYFEWENEEEIEIGGCKGTIGQAQTGSDEYVEYCMWYDAAPGLMYSLSVYTTDLDGLDLTAVADQVYVPVQGDAE